MKQDATVHMMKQDATVTIMMQDVTVRIMKQYTRTCDYVSEPPLRGS